MEDNYIKFIFLLKSIREKTEVFLNNIYQTIVSVFKVLALSDFTIKFPSSRNAECYILGNGPSLTEALNKEGFLLNKELFCVNNFPSTNEYEKLKPGNLVLLDPAFFANPDERLSVVSQTLNNIVLKTTWEINLFIPVTAKKSSFTIDELNKNSNINIYFFNYTVISGFEKVSYFIFKKNLGMPLCQNVLGACIFLTLNIGYKNINILGADHSFFKDILVNENNELYIKSSHFYSEKEKPLITKFKSPISKNRINTVKYFQICIKTFAVYFVLEKYAIHLKAKVYNATESSYIDAFERKKIY